MALRRAVVAFGGSRLIKSSLSFRLGMEKLEGGIVVAVASGHRAKALTTRRSKVAREAQKVSVRKREEQEQTTHVSFRFSRSANCKVRRRRYWSVEADRVQEALSILPRRAEICPATRALSARERPRIAVNNHGSGSPGWRRRTGRHVDKSRILLGQAAGHATRAHSTIRRAADVSFLFFFSVSSSATLCCILTSIVCSYCFLLCAVGMIFLTAFSGLLFIIPVFVTFGIYFGIEHERILRCGFSCDSTGNGTIDNPDKLVQTLFCQKSYAISPPPGEYICTSSATMPPELPVPASAGQDCGSLS